MKLLEKNVYVCSFLWHIVQHKEFYLDQWCSNFGMQNEPMGSLFIIQIPDPQTVEYSDSVDLGRAYNFNPRFQLSLTAWPQFHICINNSRRTILQSSLSRRFYHWPDSITCWTEKAKSLKKKSIAKCFWVFTQNFYRRFTLILRCYIYTFQLCPYKVQWAAWGQPN